MSSLIDNIDKDTYRYRKYTYRLISEFYHKCYKCTWFFMINLLNLKILFDI